MTVILKPQMKPVYASMLTLVAALALNDAIIDLTGLESNIKWPNDIVVNNKKVSGILTELSAEVDYINYIVVGIGVNVSMKDFPDELKDKATSLLIESGKSISRAQLIAKTMEYLEDYYERFLRTHDLSELKEVYSKVLINKDQAVRILSEEDSYIGIARGITNEGHLIVEKDNHELVEVYSGEVSVRGLYSYT